ncbi:MAG: DUF2281 domain-containing protein [Bacteroidota bacterium]
MNAVLEINQRLRNLPVELQEEVLQFIDYLLFKKQSISAMPRKNGTIEPLRPEPTFSWAGALKGMDEGLTSVEWQHKISELMIEPFEPSHNK